MADDTSYRGWAIVELMGHRQTAGWVTEVTIAGTVLLRVDTPAPEGDGVLASQPYNLPPAVRLALPAPEEGDA